jgi:hypothetical protein
MGKDKKKQKSKTSDAMDVSSPVKESIKDVPETPVTPVAEQEDISYEEKAKLVTPISHPLASKKLAKKLLKCVKKGKQLFMFDCIHRSNFFDIKKSINCFVF